MGFLLFHLSFDFSLGNLLHGVIQLNPSNDSYTVTQNDVTGQQSSGMKVPIQKKDDRLKNFTIAYVVYEKGFFYLF